MSRILMLTLIAKMHSRLNNIITNCNYNLQCDDVQKYSKRLDKVIVHFNNIEHKKLAHRQEINA